MKITDSIKNTTTFAYGKVCGLNNREAARLCLLIPECISTSRLDEVARKNFVLLSKEPKVSVQKFEYSTTNALGAVKHSRSKLVMEYEKYRKMFKAIVALRTTHREVVDNLASKYDLHSLIGDATPREAFLVALRNHIG